MTDRILAAGEQGAALAAQTAQWLAAFPPDAWPAMMAMQTQTVLALAAVERNKRRKRKASARPSEEATNDC